MRRSRYGLSVIELLVAIAVIGVLAGVGVTLLPRQGMAVDQAQRIFASSVQFARFEAIKRNVGIEVVFAVGQNAVVVSDQAGVVLRRFQLDPQGDRVTVKEATPDASIEFNARGVAVSPISRSVVIGVVGSGAHDRRLTVSGQGSVRRAS